MDQIKLWLKENLQKIAWYLIALSAIMIIYLLLKAGIYGYTIGAGKIDFTVTGQVGDFVGGFVGTIISGAGFIFLYLTLKDQRDSSKEQRESFEKERLESKFFDLIKMHRDNVSELRMKAVKYLEQGDDVVFNAIDQEGKGVFKDIFYQFVDCNNELTLFFQQSAKIHESDYKFFLEQHPFIKDNQIPLKLLAKIDICYSIVFYGVGSEGMMILRKLFEGRYKPKFISDVLRYVSLKPSNDTEILKKWVKLSKRGSRQTKISIVNEIFSWRKSGIDLTSANCSFDVAFQELVNGYNNKYIKFYGGHQFRLGHYFRHLYQSIKYINNQTSISYSQKYEYVKVLRAQLSNYEQALLFLNSLSSMGTTWEMNIGNKLKTSLPRNLNMELITKYNLIKNLPGETMYGVPFKVFYPNVQFEGVQNARNNLNYQ